MQALIVDAVRSPRGRGNDKGALRSVEPVDLLAGQLRALAARRGIDTQAVEDVLVGCVTQTASQGGNIGKLATLAAGWADSVSAMTLNRYCASGLSAVHLAASKALAADTVCVGAGVEMMSRVPMASDQSPLTHDPSLQQRLGLIPIGIAADLVCTLEGFSREDCDAYAAASQQRAHRALDQARFRSVVPVQGADGATLLARDETPRPQTTADSLAQMQPAFAAMAAKHGLDAKLKQQFGLAEIRYMHHAGNSPAMADGASAVLVASPAAARRLGLAARARIMACCDAGSDHVLALTGAVDATRKALAQAGLQPGDIDLFEVNESFAGLMLHYMKHLDITPDRLNVHGGAIALGHAMGSTGSALIGTALDELELRQGRYAVIAICGAAGVAVAMVIERLNWGA